jgi:hypothetical protein
MRNLAGSPIGAGGLALALALAGALMALLLGPAGEHIAIVFLTNGYPRPTGGRRVMASQTPAS